MSYIDSRFSCFVEPEVFIDLGSPIMDAVEADCNGSVGSRWACLRDVVFGNAAGHSVVAFVALRHPPQNPSRIRDENGVEV